MPKYLFKGCNRQWTQRSVGSQTPIAQNKIATMTAEVQVTVSASSKWPTERMLHLVQLFGANRCLWDALDLGYRNVLMRKAALVDMAAVLGITRDEVVRKLRVVRATYRYEKGCIKRRMRAGRGAYTKLKWFTLADTFLRQATQTDRLKLSANSDADLADDEVVNVDNAALVPLRAEQRSQQDIFGDIADGLTQPVVKRTWSTEDSTRFVELLKVHVTPLAAQIERANEPQALQVVAAKLTMPLARVTKRWRTFKCVVNKTLQQLRRNRDYQPHFHWWPIVGDMFDPLTLTQVQILPMAEQEGIDDFPTVEANAVSSTVQVSQADRNIAALKWSLTDTVHLLRFYGAHRCLWDLQHEDYHCVLHRAAALSDIAAAMGNGLTPTLIAKKIRILRITYMQQRKRVLAALAVGKKPEILLRWYPLADYFLRPHIGLRALKRAPPQDLPQYDLASIRAHLNLIDPSILCSATHGKGTQNEIVIGE